MRTCFLTHITYLCDSVQTQQPRTSNSQFTNSYKLKFTNSEVCKKETAILF